MKFFELSEEEKYAAWSKYVETVSQYVHESTILGYVQWCEHKESL